MNDIDGIDVLSWAREKAIFLLFAQQSVQKKNSRRQTNKQTFLLSLLIHCVDFWFPCNLQSNASCTFLNSIRE